MNPVVSTDSQPRDALATALEWRDNGHGVALATVVSTWGSSPCPVGSHLVVRADMQFEGSVSGGCVEGKVIETALECIDKGTTSLLQFGVADNEAWEVGLACGGNIEVYVEPLE